jgi:putative phosphoserine phosphatase/1-acylglycerol-3-phosphate O-acyltransferase
MSGQAAIFGLGRVLLPRPPGSVIARCLRDAGLTPTSGPGPLGPWAWLPAVAGLAAVPGIPGARGPGPVEPRQGWSRARAQRAAEAVADELEDRLPPYAGVEIEDHRAAGRTAVLVTSVPEPLITPLAERWGFDAVLATRWETSGRSYTGRLEGPRLAGGARARAMRDWAAANGIALDESYAYAGTSADAPLLAACGHPRAVNPDPALSTMAATRRWPIRWFDVPPGVVKVGGRELQAWLRPLADERLVGNAEITISGLEHIPAQGPALVVFNHRSYFDATVIGLLIAKTGRSARGIGKKEVFDAPVIGAFAHAFGGIRVDRGTGSDEPLIRAEQALRAGELIMIAPEGTIPRGKAFFEPELRGRWGAARLAHATKAPVVPVGLWGTEHVWPRNRRLPRVFFTGGPPAVTATVGPPVELAYDDVDADTRRIMAALVALLPPEARRRRTPTERELRRTFPPGYKGDPEREVVRRPGFDR